MTPLEEGEKKEQKNVTLASFTIPFEGLKEFSGLPPIKYLQQVVLCEKHGNSAANNRPKIFLWGKKTCLNCDRCRAQADQKYFGFLLPFLVTQPLLVCHLMPGLGCTMCSGSPASAGSCLGFTHQPAAAAPSFSNICHTQPHFCSTLLYSWRSWGRKRSSTGRFSLW